MSSPDRAMSRRLVLRSASVMTGMTLLSRVLGLVREQVRAVFLGTGAASDAFGLAVVIPNLFRRLLAEGAMTAAFIPVFAEYLQKGDEEDTRAFLSRFVTLLSCVATGLTILGVLLTPWLIETFFASEFQNVPGKVRLTIVLTQLMWPYLLFVSLAAALQAILNTHKIFGPSAFTPVLLNGAIIGCGIALAHVLPDPSYALVTGFLVGGVLQIVFQVPFLFRHTKVRLRLDFRFTDPGVRRVLWIMVPGVFAAGIYQINVFVSQLVASMLPGGAIAALQYSLRLQELVLGLFVVSLAQVILPTLSEQTAADDRDGVKDTLVYATRLMSWVSLPATAALVLLGAPIIRLLFQFGAFDAESTSKTAYALVFHAVGLLPIALCRVQQQVFFAHKDLVTPTKIAAVVMVVNVVLCFVLAVPLEHGGVALAGSIAAAVNTVLLVWLLRRRFGALRGGHLVSHGLRVALAALVMAVALVGYDHLWQHAELQSRWLLGAWVAGACVGGGLVYVGACQLLGVNELRDLMRALKTRSI